MSNFWDNLNKFPRFLISVLIGFFLTTFNAIFKLLKNKKGRIIFLVIITITIRIMYIIALKMTGVI
uniref:Uncharacterized protein ycf33 n=1 Tax=Kuetzingia canaliculata TaxID=228262 RepID=A0A1Z1MQA3_KUECA|nr:hypothetical protein [Kuetzingia canaliculata]ARW67951.1 hypothetical protein [Kuetzingia canaliculata]